MDEIVSTYFKLFDGFFLPHPLIPIVCFSKDLNIYLSIYLVHKIVLFIIL